MSENNRLPIRVVTPRNTDYNIQPPGGSKNYLEPFTSELHRQIMKQCQDLQLALKSSFVQFPNTPCIGKVVMKEKAIAKSHKPTALFKPNTCPIVGSENLDEILIKVTPQGLKHLINAVNSASNEDIRINMSKIKDIKAYSPQEKIGIQEYENMTELKQPIKVKLFSFDDATDNEYYRIGFEAYIHQLGLETTRLKYSKSLCIYRLICDKREILNKALEYPGVQKISFFPQYTYEFPNITQAKRQLETLPMPVDGEEYPIIGVIDSGIMPEHKYLEPWVFRREFYVPEEYRNYEHGTFVAGIIEYGDILNDGKQMQSQYKLLDVIAIPNNDPDKGAIDSLSEDRLIDILHDIVGRYHDRVKVWNMSLGTCLPCCEIISDLAVALDELQDLYNVDFLLPAGNYTKIPLRKWPPVDDLHNLDRVTSPVDSVRSITVGSIAKIGISDFVEKDMPSPFSRKGPGANFLIKPDVVYYGGNCTSSMSFEGTGVVSFDIFGNVVEGIGTSYATPAIASIYASLRSSIVEERSREFSKAFLIHSSIVPEQAQKDAKDFNMYFGYGIPANRIENILTCTDSDVTLVFSGELYDRTFIEFNDFPYPKSLNKNGKYYGEIKMTLVYTPKIDSSFGQEYCRTNIDAHFGTYDYIDDKGYVKGFQSEVPIVKKWDEKYEKHRVEYGFKWNPIKSYARSIKKGITGKKWRLMIDSIARLGESYEGQEFVLFITISDPNKGHIYNEVVQALRERGYHHYEVKIHNRVRQKLGL